MLIGVPALNMVVPNLVGLTSKSTILTKFRMQDMIGQNSPLLLWLLSPFQTVGSSVQQSNHNPFEDWLQNRDKGVDDFLSGEEIRMRSYEMLENEHVQHLLRLFSMGGHAPVKALDDSFAFPLYMPSPSPNFSYDEDRTRSGKAIVVWLKIKAAMRWGFFIMKKEAKRRAQIVQLEDQ